MTEKKRFLVIFLAGFGDRKRYEAQAKEFLVALKEAIGKMPTPVAIAAAMDAQLWVVSSEQDVKAIGSAILTRLRDRPLFEIRDAPVGADKLVIVELAEGSNFATDATVKSALSLG